MILVPLKSFCAVSYSRFIVIMVLSCVVFRDIAAVSIEYRKVTDRQTDIIVISISRVSVSKNVGVLAIIRGFVPLLHPKNMASRGKN